MDIEITDFPDRRKYSSIRIGALGFIGLVDWSTNRQFGIATGRLYPSGRHVALYLQNGAVVWQEADFHPMDIQFIDQGWGGCTESHGLVVFNITGIVFRAPRPAGLPVICEIRRTDAGIVFQGERFEFEYDLAGNLLERRQDKDELFKAGPVWLRWQRLEKAESLLDEAKNGDGGAAENATKILDVCAKQFNDNPSARAKCHRFLGELALLAGDKRSATEQWRIALKIDKKVGVKRQLAALEKRLNSAS